MFRYFELLSVTFNITRMEAFYMAKAVKIPDPVYKKASEKAQKQDVAIGAIIREWMQEAEG